jgi:hypothetical protein
MLAKEEGVMTMRSLSKERVLGALGLAVKPSALSVVLGATGIFALGMIVGGSLGLLTAPRAGRELRQNLRARLARERGEDLPQIS